MKTEKLIKRLYVREHFLESGEQIPDIDFEEALKEIRTTRNVNITTTIVCFITLVVIIINLL